MLVAHSSFLLLIHLKSLWLILISIAECTFRIVLLIFIPLVIELIYDVLLLSSIVVTNGLVNLSIIDINFVIKLFKFRTLDFQ